MLGEKAADDQKERNSKVLQEKAADDEKERNVKF